jgi:NitT/TauT family transport system substrate-binding protein
MKRSRALAVGAAGLFAGPLTVAAQGLTTLTVAGAPEESIIPALWAVQSGMFTRAGLSVEVQAQRSGTAVASGVAGGTYQVGKSSIVSLIIAIAKGFPFQLVAPGGLYRASHPHIAMITGSTSALKTGADLNGKTIAVQSLNDIHTLGIKLWMDKNGGNSSSLKIVELPLGEVAAAIEQGRIDAGGIGAPQLDAALASGKTRVLAYTFDAFAPQFMYTAWFANKDYVATHREPIAAFSRVERQSAAFCNTHFAETVDVLAKFTAIPRDVIVHMTHAEMGTTLDPKLLQPVVDACARYGVIPKPMDAAAMIAPGLA